ncbi:MAG: hypothetical protein ACTHMP_24350 [Thermomicrobiales bacterium]
MASDSATYTLTGADSSAFCSLVQAQSALGPARPTPGQADFWAFFAAINALAYDRYRHITNALLQGWADKLYAAMLQTQTNYKIDAAGMYVLYAYAQFAASCFDPNNPYPNDSCGQQGFPTDWQQRGGQWPTYDDSKGLPEASPWDWFATAVGLWKPPGSPASFFNALNQDVNVLNDALKAAGQNTSTVALFVGWHGTSPDVASVQQFEQSRFDPANWTNSGTFVQNLAGTNLWTAQSQTATALLQPSTLPADAYFFLLHLLLALPTSTAKDQQLAQQIVSASASSQEYPNDTFINQLVYLALMYLADPLGNFAWTNAQLIAETTLLSGAITCPDPASQAIRDSLARHQRVLQTDASYPLQDPYSPAIGFTQRQTDTLFALDKARQTLKA